MLMEEQLVVPTFLPSVSAAYGFFYEEIARQNKQQIRLKHYTVADEYWDQRPKIDQQIGSKLLEIILMDLHGIGQKKSVEFVKLSLRVREKLRQQYGQNLEIFLRLLGKVFHCQQYEMLNNIKTELEVVMLQLRYQELGTLIPKVIKEDEIINDSLLSVSVNQMSLVEAPFQEDSRIQDISYISAEEEIEFNRSELEVATTTSSFYLKQQPSENTRQSLAKQIDNYLSYINYYKSQLGEFCNQFGLSKPIYGQTKMKENLFKTTCVLNFASIYTKYYDRKYESLGIGESKLKAQEDSAKKILKVIYNKHGDMWEKFKKIKRQRRLQF